MVFGGNIVTDFNTVSYRRRAPGCRHGSSMAAGGNGGLSQQAVPQRLSS